MEKRTARFTILIDPRKKAIFEQLCAKQDLTPSQVMRKLVRQYIVDHVPPAELPRWLDSAEGGDGRGAARSAPKAARSRSR